jgi:hypothetical protein
MKPFFLFLCLFLVSCSSTSKEETDNGPRLAERLGKWDTTKRSSFEKQMKASGVDKDYKTAKFKEKEFSGNKVFNTGKKDGFKTKDFSQAEKQNRSAQQIFSGADDRNRMSDGAFKTQDSSFADKKSFSADKTSSMADDTFETRSDPVTRKALETSKRPYIEEFGKPGYTEDEVRGILNKQ